MTSENGVPYWSFCIEYLERGSNTASSASPAASRSGKGKIDYREILTESEFIVFAKLRDLRKEIAAEEAVPVYAIFTNEQLAAFVRAKAATKADLSQVTGVGEARLEKYGDRILECIRSSLSGSSDEAS